MKTLKVKQGKNQFKPGWLPDFMYFDFYWGKSVWEGKVVFNIDSVYGLDKEDQKDFNKGYGVAFNPHDNHDISIMLGWRYNPETNLFELTPYAHNGGLTKRVWPIDQNGDPMILLTVPIGEPAYYQIKNISPTRCIMSIYNHDRTKGGSLEVTFDKEVSQITRRIECWFGGDDSNSDGLGGKAPKDLSLQAEFKALH